jgi:hypothetical protein
MRVGVWCGRGEVEVRVGGVRVWVRVGSASYVQMKSFPFQGEPGSWLHAWQQARGTCSPPQHQRCHGNISVAMQCSRQRVNERSPRVGWQSYVSIQAGRVRTGARQAVTSDCHKRAPPWPGWATPLSESPGPDALCRGWQSEHMRVSGASSGAHACVGEGRKQVMHAAGCDRSAALVKHGAPTTCLCGRVHGQVHVSKSVMLPSIDSRDSVQMAAANKVSAVASSAAICAKTGSWT